MNEIHINKTLLAKVVSDQDNLKFVEEAISNKIPGTTLQILNKKEINSIYDEFLSEMEMNFSSDNIEYYTSYNYIDDFHNAGDNIPKLNFAYLKNIKKLNYKDSDIIKNILELNKKYLYEEGTMSSFMNRTNSSYAYFPLIYKVNNSTSNNYAIYHIVAQNLITISGEDTSQSFNMLTASNLINREEIVNLMSDYLNEKMNEFISTNIATIKNVSDDKIVFLIDESSIGRLKPRMIFEVERIYWWKSNDHQLINRMINLRMNDLISYQKQVDRNKNSKYYNEYYNGTYANQTLEIDYTKEELEAFYDSTHFMYTLKDLAGSQGGSGHSTDIKVQIDAIYDSTVSATIYSTANPNIILRKGDIFKY